jgi:lariat debranching enzyme
VQHDPPPETTKALSPSSSRSGPPPRAGNPDEITIDDIEEEDVKSAVENSGSDAPSGGTTVAASIAPPLPQNPDEITLDDEIEAVEPLPPLPPPPRETRFLALDKCLPRRQFLEAGPHPQQKRKTE